MASKPADTLDWIAAGEVTDPGAIRTAGYLAGDRLPAEHLNFVLALITEWILFLDDPDVLTCGDLTASDTVTCVNLVGTTLVAGEDVLTAGTDILHAQRTVELAAPAFQPHAEGLSAHMSASGNAGLYWTTAGADALVASLPMAVGSRLDSVSVRIRDSGVAITMQVFKATSAGGDTQLGATQTSGTGTTNQTLTVSGLSETIVEDTAYYIRVSMQNAARLYGGKYKFSRLSA